jgi:uncharacterized protein (TIGR02270 family)
MLPGTAAPFWDLVEESLEEAAFLWKRWETELSSPVRGLAEIWSWTEDRLQGALDGVRVAGDGLLRLTESAVAEDDAVRLTIGAHLLAAGALTEARSSLATLVRDATGTRLRSLIRGIEVAELDASFAPVTSALSSGGPEHLAALCRLKAFRRSTPGREVAVVFDSGEPLLQVEALRALRHVKDDSAARYVEAGLQSDSPEVRRAAVECGVRQRRASAWDVVRKLVYERNPESAPHLSLLASVGSADDGQLVVTALREPALQRSGLFALGFIGTPEAVEMCLTAMRDPKLARSAGEAYCAITGADLQRDRLAAPEPEVGDTDTAPAAHDLWPVPDQDAVRAHWESAKSHYAPGTRHLYGKPIDAGVLVGAIERGPMLRRPELINELTIRSGGRYDVEPRAFTHVQRRMMAASR